MSTPSQRAFFRETGEVTLTRYRRDRLLVGQAVSGPASIEDEWSTTIVYPGQRCGTDAFGNLVIDVTS